MLEFVIGIFVGGLLYWLFLGRIKYSGTFVIDTRDPMKDVCRLDMDEGLNSIYSKKHISLRIKVYEDDSQK